MEDFLSTAAAEPAVEATSDRRALWFKAAAVLLLLATLPMAWQWTPLNEWINFETVLEWQEAAKQYPAPLYVVLGAYLLGSLVLFPVTILNVATVFAFGPVMGNVYALAGWLASAAMGFGIGRALGRDLVQKLSRSRLHRLLLPAERHGFLTVLAVRILPIAPFTLVNFVVGASGIRFHDFILASLVGRIPGIIILTVAGLQIQDFLRNPALGSLLVLGITLVTVPFLTRRLWKRFTSRRAAELRSVASDQS
jgi:uncharacterized membrane protein YdjX (TVP38/TMEM64 family)